MAKKALKTYEKERNIQFAGDVDLDQRLSEEEFGDFMAANAYLGVNHEQREKFLKDNGYDVTRANMVDPNLSVRSEEELSGDTSGNG